LRELTHCAFSDESGHNIGRFRAIAIVSLPIENLNLIESRIRAIQRDSDITELQWKKLKNAKSRFCAISMIDYVIELVRGNLIRIDVLTWDTQDSRHNITGRDDAANFQRMYYHLFKNVLKRRWPTGCIWKMYPDEQSIMDWTTILDILDVESISVSQRSASYESFSDRLQKEFQLEIEESNSKEKVIIQIADLFAGISVYLRTNYETYEEWLRKRTGQTYLVPFESSIKLSNRDIERCKVIYHLNKICKDYRLGVSIKEKRCLWTPDPSNRINFWLYEPQTEKDKAPTKRGERT